MQTNFEDIVNYFTWWQWILLSLPLIYAISIILIMRNIVVNKLKFLVDNQSIDDVEDKWKPFVRYDRNNWSLCEIYFCAVFILPIRLVIFFTILIFISILSCFFSFGSKKDKTHIEQGQCRRFIFQLMIKILGRIMQFSLGIWWIHSKKAKIEDFDETYPTEQYKNKNQKPSLIVANHIGYLEILHFVQSKCPSFVAKSGVAKLPMIGGIARTMQCIFVDRDSNTARNQVLESIQLRCKNIQNGKKFPPMAMYPEGTCSNGKYIISFKKGAFEPLAPIKIYLFKFNDRHFHPYLDSIPIYYHLFLVMCQFANSYTVTELDTFYPDHLNLQNPETDWMEYAHKIKNIMLKVGNLKSSNSGYRDVVEYEKHLQNIKQRVTERSQSQQLHRSLSQSLLVDEQIENLAKEYNQQDEIENQNHQIQNQNINQFYTNDISDQNRNLSQQLLNSNINNNNKNNKSKTYTTSTEMEIKSIK